jgi:hypothetical protein
MKEHIEQFSEQTSLLEKPEILEVIKSRNIQPEDFHLIEKLGSFDKNLLIAELHNMFNSNKDESGRELERLIKTTENPHKRELYEAALAFYNKYSWPGGWNLVRVLEEV